MSCLHWRTIKNYKRFHGVLLGDIAVFDSLHDKKCSEKLATCMINQELNIIEKKYCNIEFLPS